ncbi:MAG: UDP-glucose/GDP-mannose dehydrogenase family protein [Candidatus Uhrbacteria bacterium]
MNLVMIGTGYVGLVTGLGFAKLGHRVACVDTDAAKVGRLDLGETPFYEPGMPELLREMQEAGRIVFTTDLKSVIGGAEIIMIAVGTPAGKDGFADLSYVEAAADSIGSLLDHEALVVVKSSVPVGTNRAVLDRIRRAMGAAGREALTTIVNVVSLPEFLRPGFALRDFMEPDRIVIGADDAVAQQTLDRLHDGITAPRVLLSLESAELTKYAANALLATKVSFINEIANIAERTGADVREVARAVGLDRRIGPHFLQAGIGYGGSCFPKDVSALHQMAGTTGYEFKLLSAVIEVNNAQRERFVTRIVEQMHGVRGRRLAVWGLAFKGGTDDVRGSSAIDIVQRLVGLGAEIVAYDPQGMELAQRMLPEQVQFAPTAVDATTGADALLVLTEWPEFLDVSFEAVRERMAEPNVFDGRNLLAELGLKGMGFVYRGVGIR